MKKGKTGPAPPTNTREKIEYQQQVTMMPSLRHLPMFRGSFGSAEGTGMRRTFPSSSSKLTSAVAGPQASCLRELRDAGLLPLCLRSTPYCWWWIVFTSEVIRCPGESHVGSCWMAAGVCTMTGAICLAFLHATSKTTTRYRGGCSCSARYIHMYPTREVH